MLASRGSTLPSTNQQGSIAASKKDAEGDQQMMDIFAALLLGAPAFTAFNLISRTIEAQRREIGIGMALGVSPRAASGRSGCVVGSRAGNPGRICRERMVEVGDAIVLRLPVFETQMQIGVFIRGTALGVAVSLLATVIPLRRALAVTPVEAISVGARAAKSSDLVWLIRGIRLPGGSLANMPLRNLPPREQPWPS
jgi:putative ABC transport system permease protein